MRKTWMALAVGMAAVAGCHSSSQTGGPGTVTADGTVIRANQVPLSVTSAFDSEHPYAKITQAEQKDAGNGVTDYTIEYVRPDGSSGKVVYTQSGAMISDGN